MGFFIGMLSGLGLGFFLWLILNRCRFKFHLFGPWTFDSAGRSQFRICRRCNLYEAQIFRDHRTGEQLTQTRVDPPPQEKQQ